MMSMIILIFSMCFYHLDRAGKCLKSGEVHFRSGIYFGSVQVDGIVFYNTFLGSESRKIICKLK